MKKISNKPFILLIDGPSCGGKSTVGEVIIKSFKNIFHAHTDIIKWLISDYYAPTHRPIVFEITNKAMEVALKNKLAVLKEGTQWQPQVYVKMAKKFNVPLYIVNIEAPWEVIVRRFEERLESRRKNGAKISNTSKKRLKELYNLYHMNKMNPTLEFNSTNINPEKIAEEIVKYIKKDLK